MDPAPEDFRWQREYLVTHRRGGLGDIIRRETTGVRWSSQEGTTSCWATTGTTRSTAAIGDSSPDSLAEGRPIVVYYSYSPDTWTRSPGSRTSAGRGWVSAFDRSRTLDRTFAHPSFPHSPAVAPRSIARVGTRRTRSRCTYGRHRQQEVVVRRRLARPVPPRHQRVSADLARGGGAARAADSQGRPGSARQARALQPPLRRVGRQEISEPGRVALRSDQRGQPRPDPRRAQIRRDEGDQVHLLRRLVDPPGDSAGAGRAVAHRARAAEPRRHAAPHRQARQRAAPGARAATRRTPRSRTAWTSPRRRSPRRWRSRRRISRSMRR